MSVAASDRIVVLSELEADDRGFDVTDARTLEALRSAEDRHFWHLTRNELIASRLHALGVKRGAKVVELGCGGGCVTAYLHTRGYDVVGVDGHRALVQVAALRAPGARFWVHDLARGVDGLPEREFDAAGLFDVIEHLEEPSMAIAAGLALVREGGVVVGTVPAMPLLWSRVDEQAGHKRRYTRGTLRAELGCVVGGVVEEIAPFNRALVPMMLVQRRLVTRRGGRGAISEANLRVPQRGINRLAAWVLRAERRMAGVLDRVPVEGSSLWFAVRKRSE